MGFWVNLLGDTTNARMYDNFDDRREEQKRR
mgnify:CR=1 FL=1